MPYECGSNHLRSLVRILLIVGGHVFTSALETENEYLEEKKERLENKGIDASHVKAKLKLVRDELEDEEASLNKGNAPGNAQNSEKPNNSNKKKD